MHAASSTKPPFPAFLRHAVELELTISKGKGVVSLDQMEDLAEFECI